MSDFVSSQEWTLHSTDLNPLNYSVWDTLQKLVYAKRREPFANHRDLQNVREKRHNVDMRQSESEKLYCSGKAFSSSVKKMEDLFSTFSADQLTDD